MTAIGKRVLYILWILAATIGCGISASDAQTAVPAVTLATEDATDIIPDAAAEEATAAPTVVPAPMPAARTLADLPELLPGDDPGAGPWLLFLGGPDPSANPPEGTALMSVNADATHLAAIDAAAGASSFAARPGATAERTEVAYITDLWRNAETALKIVSLPDMAVRTITPLTNDDTRWSDDSPVPPEGWPSRVGINIVIGRVNNPVWSPDGRYLAFIGAMEGLTANIYVYDAESGAISRLTDLSGQPLPYDISWSPDSEWLAYNLGDFQGEGAPWLAERRAVRRDGAGDIRLVENEDRSIRLVEWLDNSTVVTVTAGDDLSSALLSIDVETGAREVIYDDVRFWDVASTPDLGVWLVVAWDFEDRELFLLRDGQPESLGKWEIGKVWWEPGLDSFVGAGMDYTVYTISVDGEVERLAPDLPVIHEEAPPEANSPLGESPAWPPFPTVSPQGGFWVWHLGVGYGGFDEPALLVGDPFAAPSIRIGGFNAQNFSIAPDDRGVFFLGDGLYYAPAPDFTPRPLYGEIEVDLYRRWQATWSP